MDSREAVRNQLFPEIAVFRLDKRIKTLTAAAAHRICHASGHGERLGQFLPGEFFRRLAHVHRPVLSWAGPLAVLAIMLMWTTLLITGFALIYWPRMDTGFSYTNPADLGKHQRQGQPQCRPKLVLECTKRRHGMVIMPKSAVHHQTTEQMARSHSLSGFPSRAKCDCPLKSA